MSERCKQTSEWPSTYVSILVCSRPQCNAVDHAASSTNHGGLPSRPVRPVSLVVNLPSQPSHSSEAQPEETTAHTAHESPRTITDAIRSPLQEASSSGASATPVDTDYSIGKVTAPLQSASYLITGPAVEPSHLEDDSTSATVTGNVTGAESEAVVADDVSPEAVVAGGVAPEAVVDSIPNRNYGANKLGREQYGLSLGDR